MSKKAVPKALDFTNRRGVRNHALTEDEKMTNKRKSSVRAKVEYALLVIKSIFGFTKIRYRSLVKNANRVFVTCCL